MGTARWIASIFIAIAVVVGAFVVATVVSVVSSVVAAIGTTLVFLFGGVGIVAFITNGLLYERSQAKKEAEDQKNQEAEEAIRKKRPLDPSVRASYRKHTDDLSK